MAGERTMLYLGHFEFDNEANGEGAGSASSYGYFDCLAEAENIDGALQKFQALIERMKLVGELLADAHRVYLDSCVEVRSIPAEGLVAHYVAFSGETETAVTTPLRGVTESEGTAYAFGPDDADVFERSPFIEFK
jgi:hypothetical protein